MDLSITVSHHNLGFFGSIYKGTIWLAKILHCALVPSNQDRGILGRLSIVSLGNQGKLLFCGTYCSNSNGLWEVGTIHNGISPKHNDVNYIMYLHSIQRIFAINLVFFYYTFIHCYNK